jgi:hypothetical protein
MLKQPMAEHAGGVGFAGAGRHLDQRTPVICGERSLEICDGVDLTLA